MPYIGQIRRARRLQMMKYAKGDKVLVWWRGGYMLGEVIEVMGRCLYRIRLSNGETVCRIPADVKECSREAAR